MSSSYSQICIDIISFFSILLYYVCIDTIYIIKELFVIVIYKLLRIIVILLSNLILFIWIIITFIIFFVGFIIYTIIIYLIDYLIILIKYVYNVYFDKQINYSETFKNYKKDNNLLININKVKIAMNRLDEIKDEINDFEYLLECNKLMKLYNSYKKDNDIYENIR